MVTNKELIAAGLLSPRSRADAGFAALAALSSQLLNRGAPRLTPTPPPIDLNAVMGAYNQTLQNDLQRGLALRQFQRSEEEYARKQKERENLLKMIEPQTVQTMDDDMAPMTEQQPSALMQSLPAAMRPIFRGLVTGGQAPAAFASLFAAGLKDNTPSSIKTLNYINSALAGLPANSPQRATLEAMRTKLLTPAGTNIEVNTQKGAGGQVIDSMKDLRESTNTARGILQQMNELESLINQGAKTGFGQEAITEVNKFLRAFGLSDSDVSNEEQFRAITTESAISNVKRLGSQPTDKDLDMVFQAGPQLSNTREGNLKLIAAAKEKARRTIARNNFLNEYARANIDKIKNDPLLFLVERDNLIAQFDKRQGFGNFKYTPPAASSPASNVPGMFR